MILTGRSVLFFIILGLSIWSARKGRDLFSPIRLYLITYSFTLGIACLDLSPYSTGWETITWVVLATSGLSYVMGALSAYYIIRAQGKTLLCLGSIKEELRVNKLPQDKRVFTAVLACTALYLLVYAMGVAAVGSIPALSDKPDEARMDFAFFGVAGNFLCLGEAAVLIPVGLILARVRRYRILYLLIALVGVVSSSLLLSRYTILKMLFIAVVLYRYLVGSIRLRMVFLLAVIFVVIVMGAFFLRSKGDFLSKDYIERFSCLRVKKGYELVALPYAYVANNYWNLNYGLQIAPEGRFHHTYGLRTFHAVFQAFRQSKKMEEVFDVEGLLDLEVQKVPPFNTIPYHWNLYRDFGYAGLVIGSFLMGFLLQLLYLKFRSEPDWWRTYAYANFAFFVALSFFASIWYHLAVWIVLGVFFVVFRFTSKQKVHFVA